MFLHSHPGELQHGVEELAGLPAATHWAPSSLTCRTSRSPTADVCREAASWRLLLVDLRQRVHEVDKLRDYLSREGREHVIKLLLVVVDAA